MKAQIIGKGREVASVGIMTTNPVYFIRTEDDQYYSIEVTERIGRVPRNPLDPGNYREIVEVKKLKPEEVEFDPAILRKAK